ncbi:efflux RND transporter permease subunit [Candidatus Bandiella euplotis]|uniref:Efflux RND transporter permease subunit n=1 Tax=Candidatus Bandiella euplotis TaxID=1664265 RepID=A0ABZ0ULC7_9RICK|nr:efflux RND transporter permease subunit [Candidatus Bandiella woodruffii]WPX96939.1 Efflux RND transporter permease subunit [Candidatus Bandiella woodruffii]
MEKIIQAFTHKKRATILFLAIMVVWGYFAYLSIPKEDSPDVKIPMIYIVIIHQGISPEDSQKLLLKPMELVLRSVSGVKELKSYAYEGSGVIIVKFNAGFDSNKALNDIRAKVNDAEHNLPKDTNKPIIQEINLSLMPVLNVILTGDMPEETLIAIARKLKDKVEGIQDVLNVEISGDRKYIVEILVTPETLDAYNLSLNKLSQIIASNNSLIAVGKVKNDGGTFAVKVPSTIENVYDLYNFPVFTYNGEVVKLKDIATIKKTYKDPKYIARVNGQPAIALEVSKRTGANVISTIKTVKEIIQKEQMFLPNNLNIIYAQDESEKIIDMVDELENGILLAIILVTIVVVFSVGGRSALLIALSIPSSFLVGILIMSIAGYTLNIVVLFSLILTVGMIVDDAIVVSEYADRKIVDGMEIQTAFIHSADRMFWPIVSSTLVKIVVFLPLLFWPGVIGQFMKYMPITVVIILTNSLLFALFFQPSLGPLFGKPKEFDANTINSMKAAEEGNIEDLSGLSKIYYNMLQKVLKKPKTFVFSGFGVLITVYVFFGIFGTGVEFFPKIEPQNAMLVIKSGGDLSQVERDKITKSVEKRILDMSSEVKVFYAKSGSFETSDSIPQNAVGVIELELVDWKIRRKADAIFDDMQKRVDGIDGVEVEILAQKDGPPQLKPITINFTSRDFKKVPAFVKKVKMAMAEMGGFKDIEDTNSTPGIDWVVNVDRELAAMFKLTAQEVGNTLRLLGDGLKISSFRPDYADDEVDILLRLNPESRKITEIEKMNITNIDNIPIPMTNLATKKAAEKVSKINRVDRNSIVAVKADVQKGVLVNDKIKQLNQWLEANIEDGIDYQFKGESEDQNETSSFLSKAFPLAFIMMFMIMLIQFNSFYHTIVVMSAVFLSTVGVLLGLIITWQPFGIVMCGIGVIALSGIVLNNNILFIDTYQHLRKHGHDIEDSIIRAGVQRLRPILLTAATAILGLLPMILGITINFFHRDIFYDAPSSQWWRQLSTSIAGGLAFATALTLFFTPCLLLIGKRFDPFNKKI